MKQATMETKSDGRDETFPFGDAVGLVDHLCKLLEGNYVVESLVAALVLRLRAGLESGRYVESDAGLALHLVNEDLLAASGDRRLRIVKREVSGLSGRTGGDWQEQERALYRQNNFGFTELAVYPGPVGYMRVKTLANPRQGIHTLQAALDFLDGTSALIIDIRDNAGGYTELAEYLASLYFDGPPEILSTSLYKENGNVSAYQTLTNPLSSNRLRHGEPLFLLTSKGTSSAAEWLAYVLQVHGHATVVGERTAGLAHRTNDFPLSDDWAFRLAVGRPLVHLTNSNWEGVGVEPEMLCRPDEALGRALEIASDALA